MMALNKQHQNDEMEASAHLPVSIFKFDVGLVVYFMIIFANFLNFGTFYGL